MFGVLGFSVQSWIGFLVFRLLILDLGLEPSTFNVKGKKKSPVFAEDF